MSYIRPLTLLGTPPRVAILAGKASSFALSRGATVAATTPTQTEYVVTVNNDSQLCILREEWSIKKPALIAQHQNAVVVAAEGGAFRVDVGEGARFLCNPQKLIGTLGTVQSRLVYDESRLDILRAWSGHIWRRTSSALSATYSFMERWLRKIPIPSALRSTKPTRRPEVPVSVKEYWSKSKEVSHQLWNAAGKRSFEYTHPPKLEIHGPCSVLIRP